MRPFSSRSVEWCDGSDEEYADFCKLLVDGGTLQPLDSVLRPNSFAARSDPPTSLASRTAPFICSEREDDAGPTNHWRTGRDARRARARFPARCAAHAFFLRRAVLDGPLRSPIAHIGVELTDSAYVART